jgi:hypothetical protein
MSILSKESMDKQAGVGLKTSLQNLPNQSVLAALNCQYAVRRIPSASRRSVYSFHIPPFGVSAHARA